ncbi:MAG: nucleotidyltransferase family protein [Flavitalea sp.]
MITEAIVLAGGLGTRLKDAVPDLPKCLAPINNEPFLFYLISYYKNQGIKRFIFSLGYKHELVEEMLLKDFPELDYEIVVEDEPLGTGGAVAFAMTKSVEEDVLVLNGDTFYSIDLNAFSEAHYDLEGECTLALKTMQDFDRYGVVEINEKNRVTSFHEKKFYSEGLINGGVYAVHVPSFLTHEFDQKFSFEKDYFEKYIDHERIMGFIQDGYFIDIGVPEDLQKAQTELPGKVNW